MSVNMIPKAKELKLVSIWWFPLLPTYEEFRILADVLLSGYLNDLCSRAVSRIRQPIESLINWIIEKIDIQRASKVRSTKGLLVHVFGRIAAAFIFLIFNS